ncbi:MAG: 3'(2'), 5'-bisphosphate nucleotidase [Myxococcota bacterium]
MSLAYATELAVARTLAVHAGEAIEAVRKRGFSVSDKADNSPVTEADLAADRVIREGLATRFPRDAVLTEESALNPGDSGRTWVIDPLDGTRGFVGDSERGYAVHIGLLVGQTPVLGVVHEPRYGRTWVAERHGNTVLYEAGSAEQRCRVSGTADRHRIVTSTSIADGLLAELVMEGFVPQPKLHSVGIKVGELVGDRADVYFSHHPINAWDSCAPLVVLEAAGGRMTTISGAPLTYEPTAESQRHSGLIVASNGVDHDDIARRIQAALARHGVPVQ